MEYQEAMLDQLIDDLLLLQMLRSASLHPDQWDLVEHLLAQSELAEPDRYRSI